MNHVFETQAELDAWAKANPPTPTPFELQQECQDSTWWTFAICVDEREAEETLAWCLANPTVPPRRRLRIVHVLREQGAVDASKGAPWTARDVRSAAKR